MAGTVDGLGDPVGDAFDVHVRLGRDGAEFAPPDVVDDQEPSIAFVMEPGDHELELEIIVAPAAGQAWGNYSFSGRIRIEPAG